VNGVLVGYLRLRAFLTTLVTLIIVRAVVDLLLLAYAQTMSMSFYSSPLWDAMGMGGASIFPFSFVVLAVVAVVMHVAFSRSGPGWRLLAIGGSCVRPM
jgi:ribose transport system permease protein